jgi:hypothetical protein
MSFLWISERRAGNCRLPLNQCFRAKENKDECPLNDSCFEAGAGFKLRPRKGNKDIEDDWYFQAILWYSGTF